MADDHQTDPDEHHRPAVPGGGHRSERQLAEDVAETGTALEPGERDSALDVHDAPGTAGTGAGG